MIVFKTGNVFSERVDAIVNTVNCVGVMGRGIAAQSKKLFPENFKSYKKACEKEDVKPGKMFVVPVSTIDFPRYIINFPTKRHWKANSRLSDIDSGLVDLVRQIEALGIQSIAIPALGCGLGGLDWEDVRPMIIGRLEALPKVRVVIYEPAESGSLPVTATVRMTPGRAALLVLIDQYLSTLCDPFITLLEIHKLMYFLQEAGEPLRLQFVKAHYGPFAENLRHVLLAIEGHFISGYQDGGDTPRKEIKILPGAIEAAHSFLAQSKDPSTLSFCARVKSLVWRFEDSYSLELLATVHWLAAKEACNSVDKIVAETHAWADHKRKFSRHDIRVAAEQLTDHGFLSLA
jgi:O-acetyl-ADP-ribose deacetylase (regulator of RNase III)